MKNKAINDFIKHCENSGTSEGSVVGEIIRDMADQGDDSELIASSLHELVGWAAEGIKQLNPLENALQKNNAGRVAELEGALIAIRERFKDKLSLHKEDCFAYQEVIKVMPDS